MTGSGAPFELRVSGGAIDFQRVLVHFGDGTTRRTGFSRKHSGRRAHPRAGFEGRPAENRECGPLVQQRKLAPQAESGTVRHPLSNKFIGSAIKKGEAAQFGRLAFFCCLRQIYRELSQGGTPVGAKSLLAAKKLCGGPAHWRCALVHGDSDLFICGNDAGARGKVSEVLRAFGWKSLIDLGDITNARGTESLMPIWMRLWGVFQTPHFNFKMVK